MGPMLALRDQCAGGIRLAARALGTTDAVSYTHLRINITRVFTRLRRLHLPFPAP